MAKLEISEADKSRLELLDKITRLSNERAEIASSIVRVEADLRRLKEMLGSKESAMEVAGQELSRSLNLEIRIK